MNVEDEYHKRTSGMNVEDEYHKQTSGMNVEDELKVDIFIQHTGRKVKTIIQGLDEIDDKIVTHIRRSLHCSATMKKDAGKTNVIVQGDYRKELKNLLIESGIAEDVNIKIHGITKIRK